LILNWARSTRRFQARFFAEGFLVRDSPGAAALLCEDADFDFSLVEASSRPSHGNWWRGSYPRHLATM